MIAAFALAALLSQDPMSAEEHAARADALYAREEFAEASVAYATAYKADPNPNYLYGWAQAERRAGNCAHAVDLYREYVSLDVSEEAREVAAKNVRRCGGDIEPQTPTTETTRPPPPTLVTDPQTDPSPPTDDPERSWRSDPLGLALVSGGGALGVASLVLAVDSAQQRRLADDADIEAQYARKLNRANKTRTAGIVCGSLAGVALVAGVVRLVLVSRSEEEKGATTWIPGRGVRF